MSSSHAALVIVGDADGNVGTWDTELGSGSFLGSVPAVQALGLAYDPDSKSAIVLDRNGNKAYQMNTATGLYTSFDTDRRFQGGAVVDGVLYGWVEDTEPPEFESYNLSDGSANGYISTPGNHIHALGVDLATGQLYTVGQDFPSSIRPIATDGTFGAPIVSVGNTYIEDLEYYEGNFLTAIYSKTLGLQLLDATSGDFSTFLTSEQLNSIGVTGYMTGVAVGEAVSAVPEPSTYALVAMGSVLGLLYFRRRRK
jgi:hypothetical protein